MVFYDFTFLTINYHVLLFKTSYSEMVWQDGL